MAALYHTNARVWLTYLFRFLVRPAAPADIPEAEPDRLARMGFGWMWLLTVWQTGPAAHQLLQIAPGGPPGGLSGRIRRGRQSGARRSRGGVNDLRAGFR